VLVETRILKQVETGLNVIASGTMELFIDTDTEVLACEENSRSVEWSHCAVNSHLKYC